MDSDNEVEIVGVVLPRPLVLEVILGVKIDPRGMLLLCKWEGVEDPTWEPIQRILMEFPDQVQWFAERLTFEFSGLSLLRVEL